MENVFTTTPTLVDPLKNITYIEKKIHTLEYDPIEKQYILRVTFNDYKPARTLTVIGESYTALADRIHSVAEAFPYYEDAFKRKHHFVEGFYRTFDRRVYLFFVEEKLRFFDTGFEDAFNVLTAYEPSLHLFNIIHDDMFLVRSEEYEDDLWDCYINLYYDNVGSPRFQLAINIYGYSGDSFYQENIGKIYDHTQPDSEDETGARLVSNHIIGGDARFESQVGKPNAYGVREFTMKFGFHSENLQQLLRNLRSVESFLLEYSLPLEIVEYAQKKIVKAWRRKLDELFNSTSPSPELMLT